MSKHLHLFRYPALRTVLAIFVALSIVACQPDDVEPIKPADLPLTAEFSAEVPLAWYKMYLNVERYAYGYRPGPAPRSLAYIGLAAYEANLPGMPSYRSVAAQYAGLDLPQADPKAAYHWPTVTHFIYSKLMHSFFPNPADEAASAMRELEFRMEAKMAGEVSAEVYERSKAHGLAVAQAMWAWSATDQYGHDVFLDPYSGYNWRDRYQGVGDWVPTSEGGLAVFPNWGKSRTFATSESQKLCKPPITFSESNRSAFYAQALEVVNATDDRNWPDGQAQAFYWSDDIMGLTFSPAPRWFSIANQIIEAKSHNLETTLYAYAKLGMAVNDAAVSCWYSKYYYNLERPVTYINRNIDPSWTTTLRDPLSGLSNLTPLFPTYPSGHSTFAGAAAEVLTDVFGNNYAMLDRSHEGRTEFSSTPRNFKSFYHMAEENAYSRIPLGVHFRMDCEVGINLGYDVGRRVNDLLWRK